MKNKAQLSFWKESPQAHGGKKAVGRRKAARPIVTKSPMHLTFKSSRARGAWSMIRFESEVEAAVYAIAKRFRVRVRLYQNVGNHLHMVTQAASRREMQNFLRVVPQAVAFLVTGARKGRRVGRFWDGLVHSRVVHWGRDWFGMKHYVAKNRFEAAGAPRDLLDRWFREARAAWDSG